MAHKHPNKFSSTASSVSGDVRKVKEQYYGPEWRCLWCGLTVNCFMLSLFLKETKWAGAGGVVCLVCLLKDGSVMSC